MIDITISPDAMSSVGSLTRAERSHLAARPDWTPIWESVERLFADADATFEKIDAEVRPCAS